MNENDKRELEKKKRLNYGNEHLIYFVDYLLHKKIDFETLEDLTGLKKNTIFDSFSKDSQSQRLFRRSFIVKLFFGLRIDCEKFILSPEREEMFWEQKSKINGKVTANKDNKDKFFTQSYWNKVKREWTVNNHLISLEKLDRFKRFDESLLEAYDKVIPYIKTAKQKITVHELLLEFKLHEHINENIYRIAQKKIHDATKETIKQNLTLENNNFSYEHTFHLNSVDNYIKENLNTGDLIDWAVLELPNTNLSHMLDCMENFPNNCKFFIAPKSRFRGHYLIDEDYIVSEDYAISKLGMYPSYVFLDRADEGSPLNVLKDSINWDNKDTKRKRITYEKLDDAFRLVAHKIQGEKNNIKEEISYLKNLIENTDSNAKQSLSILNRLNIILKNRSQKLDSIFEQKFMINMETFKNHKNKS